MSSPPLVFLVCHGSRDPEYQQAAADLLARVRQQLAPQVVELVQLEGKSLGQRCWRSFGLAGPA
jgi:sirohydrochlorin cobaltochelatase